MGRRIVVVAVGGVALGCAAEPRPAAKHAVTIAPPRATSAPRQGGQLALDLERGARWGDSAPPRVLYTWTRPDQIETLKKDQRLLTKSRSAAGVPSLFDKRVADDPGPLARLFSRRELSLRRFAWSNPWATLAGWKGESYGDRLIRVELKPRSLVVLYDEVAVKRWRVVDLAGLPVAEEKALAHPERIAAVYHVYPGKKGALGIPNGAPYREFVLVNESMIARWEYATPAIRRDLSGARALLERLLDYAKTQKSPMPPGLVTLWRHAPENKTIAELFAANLAFSNEHYRLEPERISALLDLLKTAVLDNAGAPLAVTPSVRYADQGGGVAPPLGTTAAPSGACWTMPCPVPKKPGTHP